MKSLIGLVIRIPGNRVGPYPAIMRKLLHGIIGMLKTGTDFDAQRLFPNIRAVGV
jgi:hypothetical protein